MPTTWTIRTALAALFVVCGAASARAQQMPRNTTDIPLTSDYTENVDFADIDNDGDWDASFAEGGDNGNAQNHLWRNNGGAQGGTIGIFTNVTATQLPVISDASRDVEFVDFDNDGDQDLYISNTSTDSPQSNHWWTNMGGAQGGTIGFYVDQTAARWAGLAGAGSSIAPSQVLAGGGFIDFSCDCDFGDLDNDGDLDLVHSSYGGDFGGQIPTRLFLNDGAGVFTEFNPSGYQLTGQLINNNNPGLWCEGAQSAGTTNSTGVNCDIASTALDIDVGDLDGDLDLDILHGARVELPRIFKNRLEENGGILGFRDVTGAVLPPGYSTGDGHYEQELGDFDGDGDLDIYGLNWLAGGFSFNDATLKNNGTGTFTSLTTMTGSGSDDNEADFIDYDLDGDLDVFVANFAGQDRMYRNDGNGGMTLMPSGTGPGSVIPSDSLIALDADAADVDNDGDPDIFVANDANQSEWYLKNSTSANDTQAPVIYVVEQAPDRSPGASPTVIRAQVEDNQPYYGTWYIPVRLDVTVNGGPVTPYDMMSSMGQIFRGEIPGSLVGTIAYTVVATDQYGNTGQSATLSYQNGGSPPVMTPFCNPTFAGVIACPCNNDPTGINRGCDNFGTSSGGASITATGNPSLSSDTVVLTCSGENLTPLNVLFQAKDPTIPTGVIHSAGVRCASNTLKRIYSGNAAGGVFIRPGMGDASVSARSATLNDPIAPGQSRHYFSIYRDNNAVVPCGGNPASNLNLTNAGTIIWGP
ncbi:MAG: FG-GAP repeat domain-containing protein [Planctomycetota bacterium]